jgi:hypothetical protein
MLSLIGEITKTSSGGKHRTSYAAKKRKGAFVSESALHFDGDKPNSVPEFLRGMIIYLTRIFSERPVNLRSL